MASRSPRGADAADGAAGGRTRIRRRRARAAGRSATARHQFSGCAAAARARCRAVRVVQLRSDGDRSRAAALPRRSGRLFRRGIAVVRLPDVVSDRAASRARFRRPCGRGIHPQPRQHQRRRRPLDRCTHPTLFRRARTHRGSIGAKNSETPALQSLLVAGSGGTAQARGQRGASVAARAIDRDGGSTPANRNVDRRLCHESASHPHASPLLMNLPFISIVIDTITRDDYGKRPLADDLLATLDGLARQTYPRELFEILVVIDDSSDGESGEVVRRYPSVSIVRSPQHSYFAGKNAGARAARGTIVALLDSDCEPVPEWLSMLTAPFADAGVSAVAGCTRYTGRSLHAWTFSVPDFSIVTGDKSGEASAFHLNNSAFRRETFLTHPLDARIRRDGGCVLLYHELRAAGLRIMYAPPARVDHGLDFAQRGLLKKHFNRGFDGVPVYRADERGVLRGTHLFRRFGAFALIALRDA